MAHLSIVIPIYNEEARIGPTLSKVIDYFFAQDYDYELVLVFDGCTDDSIGVAKRVLEENREKTHQAKVYFLNNKQNRGKGYCVKDGVVNAKGKYVLFSDADLSTPIEEVEKFLPLLEKGSDIVIGSRSLRESEVLVRQGLLRQSMGKIFNKFVRLLAGLEFNDTQCGFKCFNREAIDQVFPRLQVDNFSFDVEILYVAKKLGLDIKDIPVKWINSTDSKVHIVRDSWRMLVTLFQLRMIHTKSSFVDSS